MSYRRIGRTRRLNEWRDIGIVLAILAAIPFPGWWLWSLIDERSQTSLPCVSIWFGVVFGPFLPFFVYSLLVPRHVEFVVDSASIRWGRINQRDRQRHVSLAEVREISIDRRSYATLLFAGRYHRYPIHHMLGTWPDALAFVDYIRTNHPEIRVTNLD